MINIGSVYELTDEWDKCHENRHIKKSFPDLKSGTKIEILKTENRTVSSALSSYGASKIKIVETGQVCSIKEVNGYWCFFVEYDILSKHIVLVKKNIIVDYVNAIKANSDNLDLIISSRDDIQKNLQIIDKIKTVLNGLENELIKNL